MSLFKSVSFVLVIVAMTMVQSCGFTPVYAKREDSADVASKLASVQIKPIKTLIGQTYVNTLEDVLDPSHIGASKEYVLEASVSKDTQPIAIEQDRTVTRYKVVVTVTYTLKEIGGKTLSSGTVKGQGDYDRVGSDYATYVSESETTNRAIRELAQDTKIKIIAALLKK